MIIIINGPINSGKTTIAKILWEKIPNTAHIEIDKIREFIDWMENKSAWEISFTVALSVAKEFLEPIDKDIFAFTFLPPLSKSLTNRGTRELNAWEINRIKETYKKESHKVSYGETIDNSSQTPQQTAEYIFNKVKNSIKTVSQYSRRDKSFYS